MVKKRNILLWVIGSAVLIEVVLMALVYFLALIIAPPRFPVPFSFWDSVGLLFQLAVVCAIFDGFLIVLLLFCRAKKKGLRVLSWLSVLPMTACIITFCLIGFVASLLIWHSETNDIENFGKLDEGMEHRIQIGDQSIVDMMSFSQEDIKEYHYYCFWFGTADFDIYFEVQLDDAEFAALVEQYSSNDIFIATPAKSITTDNGEIVPISGQFTVATEDTSVDQWDEMYIAYSEETNTFYFKLKGFYYT